MVRKGGHHPDMANVHVREGESFEHALRRFKKQCEKEGILAAVRRRRHYEKPSQRKRRKQLAAQKRLLKKMRRR